MQADRLAFCGIRETTELGGVLIKGEVIIVGDRLSRDCKIRIHTSDEERKKNSVLHIMHKYAHPPTPCTHKLLDSPCGTLLFVFTFLCVVYLPTHRTIVVFFARVCVFFFFCFIKNNFSEFIYVYIIIIN